MRQRGVISLVLPSGLRRVTGGNLYDEVALRALRRRGWETLVVEAGDSPPFSDLVIVDSLALRLGPPRTTAPVVALVHQVPSEATGRTEQIMGERAVLRSCDLVVVVSEWLREQVSALTRAKIEVISPGWDRSWAERGSRLADGLVLCVANAEPGKGVPEVIEAVGVAGDPTSTLVIVGDVEADPEEARRVRGALSSAGFRVRLAGVLSPGELASWYSRARLLATASRYEGWPIAVAEAMASGIPVAGFRVPGLRELVRPGKDGLLVAPGDIAALGQAVAALLADRTLAATLGTSARERAMNGPTWAECGERFADCVEALVGGGAAVPGEVPARRQRYVKGGAAGGPA